MKIASLQILAILLVGCASLPERQINVQGMSKDQVILETKRFDLETKKLEDKREERKAWWTSTARTAGTILINIGGSWLRAKFAPNSGFAK